MQTIRIALFSHRNKPILTTIIALTIHPKYNFTLAEAVDIDVPAIDIAIVTASDAPARALLSKTLAAKPSIQVLYLARDETEFEPASDTTKQFMLHKHLMADLVGSLNRLSTFVPPRRHDVTAPLTIVPAGPSPAERAATARAAVNIGAAKPPSAKPAKSVSPTSSRPRLRALMVDANPTVHAQLREVIESIGMKCDTAKSANEALAHLALNTYNIVYVDGTTKELDGYKLLRNIKHHQNHKTAGTIVLTSKTAPFDVVQGAQAGCDSFIVKPIVLKNFYSATVAALSQNIDHPEVSSLTRAPA